MKNKKIFISIIMCIIVIIAVILILLGINNKNITIEGNNNIQLSDEKEIQKCERTSNTKIYYTIDERITSYLNALKNKNSDIIMSYLNEDFISSFKYDKDTIFQGLDSYNNYDSYITTEMYEVNTNQYSEYYTKGRIDGKDIFFTVGIDKNNKTFNIAPINERIYTQKISDQIEIEDYENKTIEGKKYNFFNYKNLDNNEELVARLYYAEYIRIMLVDSEEAYNKLDTEYKKSKFETIEKFREYINNHRDNLQAAYRVEVSDSTDFESFNEYYKYKEEHKNLAINSYSVQEYDDYTQYVCIDKIENYFILNVKYPGDYTVLLDKYSIDTSEFITKYNSSKDENKVAMNAEKIKNALNSQDYLYIYNKLDEEFKQTKFSSLEQFENYVKNNLFRFNNFSYTEATKFDDIYELKLEITDLEKDQDKKIEGSIIMQLKEGTDYAMSFNFE